MDLAHNLGVCDFFAALFRYVVEVYDKESVIAFDVLVGALRVGSDALIEAAEFVGVQLAPDILILGVLEEMAILKR